MLSHILSLSMFSILSFFSSLFSEHTSNRVFTTVMGINRAPDMDRAVMPKEMACRGVRGSSKLKACFNQCSDEKYKPTPGITLVIDCKQLLYRNIDVSQHTMLIFRTTSYRCHAFPESEDILLLNDVCHCAQHSIF